MKCPFCGFADTKVIDSRPADDNAKIRRRRECINCSQRFTTYESVETMPILVIKKDNSREPFDRNKLFTGMMRACEKRPIDTETLESAIDRIEQALLNSMEREVSSVKIGELTMQELKCIDEVAYIRFASVYREFESINAFLEFAADSNKNQ